MTVTAASFREAFPEFADVILYPSAEIDFWLGLSVKLLNVSRWGDVFDFGQQLFVAHNLCLQYGSKNAAGIGNNPGLVEGPVSSGSADKVSYARSPSLVMDPANGHWNLSTYGLRYIQLVKMVGAGPVHVGIPLGGDVYEGAWPGPLWWPM